MTNSVLLLSVVYEENDPRTYSGIEARLGGEVIGMFNSGTPRNDYLNAISFTILPLVFSPSFDSFIQDGGSFAADSELLTDKEIVSLFDGKGMVMHNGNHDPKEEAEYNKIRLNALSNADRVGLVKGRFDKDLREQMTIEEAVELSSQINLIEYLDGTVG